MTMMIMMITVAWMGSMTMGHACSPCVCMADRMVCHSQPPVWQTLPWKGMIRHLDGRGVPVDRLDIEKLQLQAYLPNYAQLGILTWESTGKS